MQPQHILSDTKVYRIRRLYHSGSWRQWELAYFFDVSPTIIQRILERQDWGHLQGELRHHREGKRQRQRSAVS